MGKNIEEIELTDEELRIANTMDKLFKSEYITIGVNIEPEYAKSGSGQWNITQAYAKVGGECIKLDDGRVEIIEGV